MNAVVKIWCEWDIGLEDVFWLSEEKARKDAKKALRACDITETIDELEDKGLIGFEWCEVRG